MSAADFDKWEAFVNSRGDRRFGAYYYYFDPTGDPDIDLILASVATAGKLGHHTDSWAGYDSERHYGEVYGGAPAEMIQLAANRAAQRRRPTS